MIWYDMIWYDMIWCDVIPAEPLVPRGLVSLPFSTRNVLGAQKIGWSKRRRMSWTVESTFWISELEVLFSAICVGFLHFCAPSSVSTTTNNWSFWCDYLLILWFPMALSLNLLDVGWHHLAQVVPQGSDQGFCNKLIKQHKGGLRNIDSEMTKNIETSWIFFEDMSGIRSVILRWGHRRFDEIKTKPTWSKTQRVEKVPIRFNVFWCLSFIRSLLAWHWPY